MKLRRVFIGALVFAVEISVGALEDDLAVVLDQYISGEVVAGNVRADKNSLAVCSWGVPASISRAVRMRRNMAQRMIQGNALIELDLAQLRA